MRTPPPAGVTTLKEAIDNLREVFRNSSVDKRMFAAAMAFQQHANVCEDPDSRRQIHLEFLGCYYNLSRDADTKQEIMEKMKALL